MPGEITKDRLNVLRAADLIYLDEIKKAGLYDTIWQAFAVLLPVQTVGVMGDSRTYENVCALRAVTSTDGMTADYFPFDHEFLVFYFLFLQTYRNLTFFRTSFLDTSLTQHLKII